MTQKIIGASVVGKSQNRTALGMMHAFIAMHPSVTAMELKAQFSKQKVCPDTGISQLFYTPDEIEQEKLGSKSEWFTKGNACFVADGEWLILGNGQKLAFNKVWTATSLALLQQEMAKFNITGTVDKKLGDTQAGFSIRYDYEEYEEESQGLPSWIWIVLILVLIVGGYFAYTALK